MKSLSQCVAEGWVFGQHGQDASLQAIRNSTQLQHTVDVSICIVRVTSHCSAAQQI